MDGITKSHNFLPVSLLTKDCVDDIITLRTQKQVEGYPIVLFLLFLFSPFYYIPPFPFLVLFYFSSLLSSLVCILSYLSVLLSFKLRSCLYFRRGVGGGVQLG